MTWNIVDRKNSDEAQDLFELLDEVCDGHELRDVAIACLTLLGFLAAESLNKKDDIFFQRMVSTELLEVLFKHGALERNCD